MTKPGRGRTYPGMNPVISFVELENRVISATYRNLMIGAKVVLVDKSSGEQLPDPVATVGVNNLPINGPDAWSLTRDFMTMTSVGVVQEFTRAEKREARAERFAC